MEESGITADFAQSAIPAGLGGRFWGNPGRRLAKRLRVQDRLKAVREALAAIIDAGMDSEDADLGGPSAGPPNKWICWIRNRPSPRRSPHPVKACTPPLLARMDRCDRVPYTERILAAGN